MSRGLGPEQRTALRLLAEAEGGLSAAELAAGLGLADRRTRTLIDALADRDLVAVVKEPGSVLRVWDAAAHRRHVGEQAIISSLLARARDRTEPTYCANCGAPTNAEAKRRALGW